MKDSNYTLRFPRSTREIYGYSVDLEQHTGDKWVGIVCVFAAGFLLGLYF